MKLRLSLFVIIFIYLSIFPIYSARIISLAPGITEIVFKLDLGDELVGITRYCDYPPETSKIKKIGGLIDLNLEMIISLKPDIIFHYPEHKKKLYILRNRVRLISVPHKNIKDLYRSINIIATEAGARSRGIILIKKIKKSLRDISNQPTKIKPRIMIVAARDPSSLRNMTIVGSGDYLNEILTISGAKNCYEGTLYYPSVSLESVIKMDPDIIIEFSYFFKKKTKNSIIKQWNKYPGISAVKRGKIYIISEQFWLRPGPRIIKIAEALKKMLRGSK